MKREIRGLRPGQYYQDDGDCILDIYEFNESVHICFVDLDMDIYYHWVLDDEGHCAMLIGRAADGGPGVKSQKLDVSREVRGLLADDYFGDQGKVMLAITKHDDGVELINSDLDNDAEYRWVVDENGTVVRFALRSPFEIEEE